MSQSSSTPRRLDPTVLPLVVAGLVLVGAVLWLLGRPMPDLAAPPESGQAAEVAALRAEAGRRLGALEARPVAPDMAPLVARIGALEGRPGMDISGLAPRAALENLAPRAALENLAPRAALETLARELQATLAQSQARIAAAEATLAQRAALADAQGARLAGLEAALAQRAAAIEAQATRLATLEATAQRFAALEGRAARLATIDSLRTALEAGRPLGAALGGLPNAPAALTRFAAAAPPTEAALRLAFEDAARAGRTANDSAREGASTLDAALSRLSGLVTVRRGEEMVWGDAALAEIERARRAVEAGDLEAALARLARLSPPAREAMRGWIGDAEALVAARAALRALAAG